MSLNEGAGARKIRRRLLLIVGAPIVLLPMLLIDHEKSPAIGQTAWCASLMATYWATECLPMAVTSLLPMVLFPLLGVLPADTVSRNYFQDKIVLFFGGLVIACALELVNLHRRVALCTLLLFGSRPPQLLLGFMVSTAFISMWMSNTATAAMMMPIAEAVLGQLEHAAREELRSHPSSNSRQAAMNTPTESTVATSDDEAQAATDHAAALADIDAQAAQRFRPMGKAMVLSIAYAANIGGMATLTGTGPNLVLAGDVAALFPQAPGLSFASWIAFGLPLSACLVLAAWGLFCRTLLRGSSSLYQPARVSGALRAQYAALGPMTWRERLVMIDFLLLALLWITRAPKFIPGWGDLFAPHHVTDGTVAALMAALLFALPADPPAVLGVASRRAVVAVGAPDEQRAAGQTRAARGGRGPAEVSFSSMAPEIELASAVEADTARDTNHRAVGAAAGGATAVANTDTAQPSEPMPSHPTTQRTFEPLLEWQAVQTRLPWHVIFLLGGGLALADACLQSGLSTSVGDHLASLQGLPPSLVSVILMLVVSATTTVTSNVATASIFLPVVAGLAQSMRVHPLAFMVPVVLTTSLAFVLPVSTPPNAMAFASGRLEVRDMVGLGLCMNVVGIVAIFIWINTIGIAIFGLGGDQVPAMWRMSNISSH